MHFYIGLIGLDIMTFTEIAKIPIERSFEKITLCCFGFVGSFVLRKRKSE